MNPDRPARRRRRRHHVVPAACLVAILPLAGCSDDDKNDGATPTSVGTATTARPVDTSFTGEGSEEFCRFITTFTEGSQNVSPTASPAELETSFREALTAIDQAVAVAPGEIKGDVVSIADTFERVVTAVSTADFNLDQVDTSTLEALQSEGFLDSVTRLQAYLTTICRTS
jgi:hypothetical protein